MVTLAEPILVGPRTYRLSWSSDLAPGITPTFRVYRDGVLIATTGQTSWLFTLAAGESPVVEVLDDDSPSPAPGFPARLTLHWRESERGDGERVDHYRVEQFVGAAWVPRRIIRAPADGSALDNGPYHRFETPVLADDTTHQWRVLAVDEAGNPSPASTVAVLMVRHPDPPKLSFEYDPGTHAVTVAAG